MRFKFFETCEWCGNTIRTPHGNVGQKNIPFGYLGYLFGLFFIGLGVNNIVIAENLFYTFVGIFVCFIGLLFFYITYTNKPEEPLKPSIPTVEGLVNDKNDLITSRQKEVEEFKETLGKSYKQQTLKTHDMSEIDRMDGFEFEEYIARVLLRLGYVKATVTKKSGDFGVDVIAVDSNNIMVGIQCKRYGTQNLVGLSAIQEIFSATAYRDCEKAMVITSSYFTNQAVQMAQKLGVELWNRKTLSEKIAGIGQESWNDFLSKYYIKPCNLNNKAK